MIFEFTFDLSLTEKDKQLYVNQLETFTIHIQKLKYITGIKPS